MKFELLHTITMRRRLAAAAALFASILLLAWVSARTSEPATARASDCTACAVMAPSAAELALHPRFALVAARLHPGTHEGWRVVACMQSQRLVARQLADERRALELARRIGRLCDAGRDAGDGSVGPR